MAGFEQITRSGACNGTPAVSLISDGTSSSYITATSHELSLESVLGVIRRLNRTETSISFGSVISTALLRSTMCVPEDKSDIEFGLKPTRVTTDGAHP